MLSETATTRMSSPGPGLDIPPVVFLAATDAMQWVIYAMLAVCIVYVVVRPMMRKKKDPMEKPMNFSLSEQRAVERQMSDLLVELSEMARKVTAQLDTRSRKLEMLIEDADRKIEELKRLTGEKQSSSAAAAASRWDEGAREGNRRSAAPPASEEPMLNARYSAIYDLADQGRTAQEIAHELDRPQGEVELILALRR
jgi:hypothetical protein